MKMLVSGNKVSDSNGVRGKHRGYIHERKVRAIAFYIISLCVIVSILACILAIWDFVTNIILWKIVATCLVVASGCVLFTLVNLMFGTSSEK